MNNDIIYEILMNAPMTSFVNLCQTNSQFRKQCTPAMWQTKFNQYNIPYHLPVSNWALLYDEYQFGIDNASAIDRFIKNAKEDRVIYFQKSLSNTRLIKMLKDLGVDNMKNNKIHLSNYRRNNTRLMFKYNGFSETFAIEVHVHIPEELIKPFISKLFYYGYLIDYYTLI